MPPLKYISVAIAIHRNGSRSGTAEANRTSVCMIAQTVARFPAFRARLHAPPANDACDTPHAIATQCGDRLEVVVSEPVGMHSGPWSRTQLRCDPGSSMD